MELTALECKKCDTEPYCKELVIRSKNGNSTDYELRAEETDGTTGLYSKDWIIRSRHSYRRPQSR